MATEPNPASAIAVPSDEDILRFAVALLTARDNDDLVDQVIDQQLAEISQGLRATYLKVVLRVVVCEFFGPMARIVDRISPGFTNEGLGLQAAANEGVDLDP